MIEVIRRGAHLLCCRASMVLIVAAAFAVMTVLPLPLLLLPVVLYLVGNLLTRKLCVHCAADLPLDPSVLVHRHRRALRLLHRGYLRFHTLPRMLAGVLTVSLPGAAALWATLAADQPGWMILAAFYAACFPWLLFADVVGRHNRVAPWCPWCGGGDDGEHDVTPDPVPAGTLHV